MKNLACLLLVIVATGRCCFAQAASDTLPDFQQLLQKIVAHGPDPCGAISDATSWNSEGIEGSLFSEAADAVVRNLNAGATTSPRERAAEALKRLEKMSAEINVAWPDENRFHFEISEFSPVLVAKVSIRTQADVLVFGVPQFQEGKPNRLWRQVSAYSTSANHQSPQTSIAIFPLHRGPSGNVRFLAHFDYSACAGGFGVGYEAFEWDGKFDFATEILDQQGEFGLEAPKAFPVIGELRTKGALLTIPYCWSSAIDYWDNPSLCSVDTYDLSRDDVRFRSRRYNRPELVPIAKAMEYAGEHNLQAVRGYCGSEEIARRLVREIPDISGASDPKIARTGSGRERVVFVDAGSYFDVEKQADGWVITAFGQQ